MRNISIRIAGYDVSIVLFILMGSILGAAATYMWANRSTTIMFAEPLALTYYPTTVQTHPGENQTLNITIENTTAVDYTVTLAFTLTDTTYQTDYVTFSNATYTVNPGTNQLIAWIYLAKKAQPTILQLTTQFFRE
jgi:hypothetical protein